MSVCARVMWVLLMAPCVGAVDGSTLAVAVSVTTCVSILCVCVSGTRAQLCYCLNPQTGKRQGHGNVSLSLGRGPGSLGTRLGSTGQAGLLGWSGWRRWPCVLTSFSMLHHRGAIVLGGGVGDLSF